MDGADGGVVGRDAELAVLRSLSAALAAGRGAWALVEGEPGIGKSALLASALAEAAERGSAVSCGCCDELGRRFPLSVLLTTLAVDRDSPDRLRAAAAGPPVEFGPGGLLGTGDSVAAAIERVLELVDRLCAAGPLVLAVDGLHWADDASLQAWESLSLATARMPLLLVGTSRPVPRRAELERLRHGARARNGTLITLGRLGSDGVAELTRRLTGAAAGPGLAGQLKLAGGNPLYVREILTTLIRARALRTAHGIAELADPGPRPAGRPGTDPRITPLAAMLAARLDFLSGPTREALRTAALLGADFSASALARALDRPVTECSALMQEAADAGVLEAAGERLRFRHGLLRHGLYESIPAALRACLHQEAARAVQADGEPPARVADLLLPALSQPGAVADWALDWLTEHAPGLAHHAPAVAAELFERALLDIRPQDPRTAVLEDQLAQAAFARARDDVAEQAAGRVAAGTADPERLGRARWILAYVHARTGRPADAIGILADAAEDPRTTALWRARLAALSTVIVFALGRYAEAEKAAAALLGEGERPADPMTTGYALHTVSLARFIEHDFVAGNALVGRALTVIGTDMQLADLRLVLRCNQICALCGLDRFEEAADILRLTRPQAEQTGSAARRAGLAVCAAELAFQQGRWDDALAELATALGDGSPPEHLRDPIAGLAALVAGHRDDQRTAAHQVDELSAGVGGGPLSGANAAFPLLARALAAEQAGRPGQALAILKAIVDPAYRGLQHRAILFPVLVRLAVDEQDPDTARAAAAAIADEARSRPLPHAVAAGEWCRGLVTSDPAPVRAAADRLRRAGRRLELANALEDAALLLAGAGDRAAARTALAEAVSLYADLGAAWDSRRAWARLRPHGLRPGVRRARRGPRLGWAALTETEARIAELAASGSSNPDIAAHLLLSRRTVESHVSHILAKLQVDSRREIADVVRDVRG